MTAKEKAIEIYTIIKCSLLPEEQDLENEIAKSISLATAIHCYQSAIATYLMFETNSDIEVQIIDFWEEVKQEIQNL